MKIEDFLLARLEEAEKRLDNLLPGTAKSFRKILEMQRKIIRYQQSWPVLVTNEPEFSIESYNINDVSYLVKQRISWLTNSEYIARFGTEAPTSQFLKELVMSYRDHPDYDPSWE